MSTPTDAAQTKRSEFATKLSANPEILQRYSEALRTLREAATEDVEAIASSERLTSEDFAVYINARAEDSSSEVD